MQRADGWPGLRERYRLSQQDVRGLAHDLAYRGVASGAIDVTDLYSTDAEIAQYDLVALEDDASFFPNYDALIVCRADIGARARERHPAPGGSIDEAAMVRMNARAKIDRESEASVAADFLRDASRRRAREWRAAAALNASGGGRRSTSPWSASRSPPRS